MPCTTETIESTRPQALDDGVSTPGLVLVWTPRGATCQSLPLPDDGLVLGRDGVGDTRFHDPRISRTHCRVRVEDGSWRVEDLGSRNGTVVDGCGVRGTYSGVGTRVLRVGRCLFILARDLSRFHLGVERHGDVVVGTALREAWREIARASTLGNTLLITGESGVGKELAARRFHEAPPRRGGPLVDVNCAAIPESLAESLLFGSRKGAFSGSTDSPGYLLSAHRGTLFLDEVGELSLHVQGKLLRALESREVLPLGATSPRAVDFRLCLATNRDLRGAVVRGAFREDLYFRTCRPSVTIPPLRERVEEIPWLVESMLASLPEPRAAHFSLVEACMLRAWSGNVRELAVELRSAALRVGPGEEVTVNELDPDAGRLLAGATPGAIARLLTPREGVPVARALDPPPPPEPPRPPAPPRATDATTPPRRPESARSHAYRNRERIIAALREARGNVTEAARRLDIPRTQLRRWIAKLKLDPKQYR